MWAHFNDATCTIEFLCEECLLRCFLKCQLVSLRSILVVFLKECQYRMSEKSQFELYLQRPKISYSFAIIHNV